MKLSWRWFGIRIQTKFLAHSFPRYLFLNSDVDDVHEMMDDIQEQTELADEISRAISEPAGFGMDVDEVRNRFALFHSNTWIIRRVVHQRSLLFYGYLCAKAKWYESCLWLATWLGKMVVSFPLRLPAVYCKKIVFFFYEINPLLTKTVWSRWLDIGLVHF